ncbi:MAG: DUF2892 domain-containing protein [Saprospiraceae bacterium]|nr:DUF2892 domain-containing protein [Saprospiraceae bacterium]
MKKNMGSVDRAIRTLIAAVVAILYFTNVLTGTLGIVLLAVAIIFLGTSLISSCPIYSLFGWRTCTLEKSQA